MLRCAVLVYARSLLQVILVNGGTASASELLAGALHDAAGIPLIGEKTFGKGVTQRVVPLSDGSILLVSTASYMTPKHVPVHKVLHHIQQKAACHLSGMSLVQNGSCSVFVVL